MEETTCPKCDASMAIMRLPSHMKERHGIDMMPNISTTISEDETVSDVIYEYGDPVDYESRNAYSEEEAKEVEPHMGEVQGLHVDENGYKKNIDENQAEQWVAETNYRLRQRGAEPMYIQVGRSESKFQYHASPLALAASAVIIAAAIIAVLVVTYFTAKALFELVGGGAAGATAVTGLMIGVTVVGGYLLYKVLRG